MLYVLAIFLPPVAVLLTGKTSQAFINLILTFLMWVPGVIHAFLVINNHHQEERQRNMYGNPGFHR